MSRVIAAFCILIACGCFVGLHAQQVLALSKDSSVICEKVEDAFKRNEWEEVQSGLEKMRERWSKSRFWACLTVDTKEIEEIEISLRQSMEYAKIKAKEDFIGEFVMFQMSLEHLPHREGFSLEELL